MILYAAISLARPFIWIPVTTPSQVNYPHMPWLTNTRQLRWALCQHPVHV